MSTTQSNLSYPPEMQEAIERYTIAKKSYLNKYTEDKDLVFNAMLFESSRRYGQALYTAHRVISILVTVCVGLCFYILYKGY